MAYRETAKVRQRRAQARERVLEATMELVAEDGFRNAQVAQIAERAEVAIGSVYRHFASKGELFSEVFRIATEREVNRVAEALAVEGGAADRLEHSLRVFALRAMRAPTLAWSLIAEPVDPQVDADRLFYRQAYAELFQGAIEDGIASGEFPAQDPRVGGTAIVGTIAETLIAPLSPTNRAALGEVSPEAQVALIDGIVRFCLQALTGTRR